MRYLTKEWYDLCQKQSFHYDLRVHKGAGQKDEALYLKLRKRKEKAFLERERGFYDKDPRVMLEMNGAMFVAAEKFINKDEILEEDTIVYNMPLELIESINKQIEAYDSRPPFDEEECRVEFNNWHELNLSYISNNLPKEFYSQIADPRLYALGYCTKEIKSQLIKYSENNRKRVSAISDECFKVQKNEQIPEDLLKNFSFHDSKIESCEFNCDLILRMDDENAYTGCDRIIFHDAKIIKQEKPIEGSCWLYNELYRSEAGYEAHILFWKEGYCELDNTHEVTISCKDITIDKE